MQKRHGVVAAFALPKLIHGICNFTEAYTCDSCGVYADMIERDAADNPDDADSLRDC